MSSSFFVSHSLGTARPFLVGNNNCSLLALRVASGVCRDSPDLQELRGRIIQVFFKHLTSSNEVAVDMSQEGLAAVIAYQKMPKTLLQVRSTALSQLCANTFQTHSHLMC